VIELSSNLDVLTRPTLDLSTLTLAGVAFGAPGRSIAYERIVEVALSPIVFSWRWGTDIGSTYFDANGAEIPQEKVIDSVIDAEGIVHFAGGMSLKLGAGRVVGFALHGRAMEHFGVLESFEDVVAMFGTPDRSREEHGYGELMGHSLYYAGSRKLVEWDAIGHGISLINLGDWPRNF